jgi:hypothetical protein
MVRIDKVTNDRLNKIKNKELVGKGLIVCKLVKEYLDKKGR